MYSLSNDAINNDERITFQMYSGEPHAFAKIDNMRSRIRLLTTLLVPLGILIARNVRMLLDQSLATNPIPKGHRSP